MARRHLTQKELEEIATNIHDDDDMFDMSDQDMDLVDDPNYSPSSDSDDSDNENQSVTNNSAVPSTPNRNPSPSNPTPQSPLSDRVFENRIEILLQAIQLLNLPYQIEYLKILFGAIRLEGNEPTTLSIYCGIVTGSNSWNVKVYVGRDLTGDPTQVASQNVTLNQIQDLLGDGRTLYLDNFYTSVPLGYQLLEQKTHLVGTLRSNREYIPTEVKDARLRKGDLIAKESPEGVTIVKWRDKRDVTMLSTCHLGTKTVVIKSKRQTETTKPKCSLSPCDT
ncbi:Transposase IS4 [Popillia japonica]|uniref:Transposase IS4 n=1 Tax=Popillia japonica TaxID=7064 RepID=A0AAW1MCJ4_POPJA